MALAPKSTPTGSAQATRTQRPQVLALPIRASEAALVTALRSGHGDARRMLFDGYGGDVERVLYRILGPDPEITDLLQDVFVVALGSIDKLREPEALRGWLTGIAVNKARKCILRRRRWRFIQFLSPADLPEREALVPPAEVSEALRRTYAVLERLPADERVAFALRHIDGMELTAVAEACEVSLATIKRRLARAQRTFAALAAEDSLLSEWLLPKEEVP